MSTAAIERESGSAVDAVYVEEGLRDAEWSADMPQDVEGFLRWADDLRNEAVCALLDDKSVAGSSLRAKFSPSWKLLQLKGQIICNQLVQVDEGEHMGTMRDCLMEHAALRDAQRFTKRSVWEKVRAVGSDVRSYVGSLF